jgi:holo-[acyl-carrier protein] synthase
VSGSPRPGTLLGIGIDLVDLGRMRKVLARRPSLAERVFTPTERVDAARLADPARSYAGRFAAKEAVMKALGVGLGALDWWDVETCRLGSGRPQLAVRGRAADLAASLGVGGWQLSITHTDTVASAVVVALA